MQTKKILSIALVAALVSSVAAVSVSARETIPEDETYNPADHSLGVIGAFNGWSEDIAKLSDADGDGIYTAVIEGVEAGSYEFKVRADDAWEDSWGTYEPDNIRTFNSQTNCSIAIANKSTVYVSLDTTGADPNVWGVTYYAIEEGTGDSNFDISEKTFGVVGSFTNWGGDADVAMTDEDGDGVYTAKIDSFAAGTEFKVRADSAWTDSWGVYEEDNVRTYNSQTNVKVAADVKDVTVYFSTNGADYTVWPVSYSYYDADGVYYYVDASVPVPEEKTDEETGDNQDPENTDDNQGDEDGDNNGASDEDVPAYTTTVEDYVFFDNTKTQWDQVSAYWFGADDNGYFDIKDPLGREYNVQASWPGKALEQVLDEDGNPTNYWRILKPIGATTIIFNNGHSDDEVVEEYRRIKGTDEEPAFYAYQTEDIPYDSETNGGQVYAVNDDAEAKAVGKGAQSLKYTYASEDGATGAFAAYTGPFTAEEFGQDDLDINNGTDPVDVDPADNNDPSDNNDGDNGDNNGGDNTVVPVDGNNNANGGSNGGSATGTSDAPQTGDSSMAVVFAAVAAAALGAIVVTSKKKERV